MILGGTLLLLLLLVVVFAGLAPVVRVPYPILLVVCGIGLSLLPHMPRFALPPEIVFLVFLPPLLYSAAWTLSWREFQRNFSRIAMLAFGLVAVTVVLMTVSAPRLLPGFDWKSGLLLGAVVAATDAIAATAVARRVGLPNSLIALLEAESLVNDGTGLLALQFGIAILYTGHAPGLLEGTGELLYLTGGGVAIGLVLALAVSQLERLIDDGPIEIAISVLLPYVAYTLGDRAHVSGVMAVIACGMYMSRQSTVYMSAEVRLQTSAVWEALTFILNGVLFLLLGLQLPYVLAEIQGTPWTTLLLEGAGFSIAMIALRIAWVFVEPRVSSAALRAIGAASAASSVASRELLVVGWGGMRGVLCLAAAVSLPISTPAGPFHQRSMIVFLAFSLIVSTLVLQGLSLPWIIRRLSLTGFAQLRTEAADARRVMLQAAVTHLNRRRSRELYGVELAHALSTIYRQQLEALSPESTSAAGEDHATGSRRQQALLDVLAVERGVLLNLRDQDRIDDEVLRSLQKELDLSESRLNRSSV